LVGNDQETSRLEEGKNQLQNSANSTSDGNNSQKLNKTVFKKEIKQRRKKPQQQ